MIPVLSHYHLARVVLEAKTPLSIATGAADGVFDVALVRDANGLPAIPGTSLAGVLRHRFQELYDEDATKALFGYQERDRGDASRLHVSWGALLDDQGRAVEGLLIDEAGRKRLARPLLGAALESADHPLHRDRVRINHRGAASAEGKFDRAVLPAGHRFAVEIALWSADGDDPRWHQLLALLKHPAFRLGGAVRAGLGRMCAVRVRTGHFDLGEETGRAAFAKLSRAVDGGEGLVEAVETLHAPDDGGRYLTATLQLTPRAFWRVGQGDTAHVQDPEGRPADRLPKIEQQVVWRDGKAGMGAAQLLLPGSSLKGALAHRFAFHANRLAKRWAEDTGDTGDDGAEAPELLELFGFARDDDREGEKGRAGRLFIDDAFVDYSAEELKLMMHNAIDRFSGGVREHLLFSEELVWRKGVTVRLTLDTEGVGEAARRALRHTLADLADGRLPLGAGAAKGHGFFTAGVEWSDEGRWIDREEAQ